MVAVNILFKNALSLLLFGALIYIIAGSIACHMIKADKSRTVIHINNNSSTSPPFDRSKYFSIFVYQIILGCCICVCSISGFLVTRLKRRYWLFELFILTMVFLAINQLIYGTYIFTINFDNNHCSTPIYVLDNLQVSCCLTVINFFINIYVFVLAVHVFNSSDK